jgi:hypothetical protein
VREAMAKSYDSVRPRQRAHGTWRLDVVKNGSGCANAIRRMAGCYRRLPWSCLVAVIVRIRSGLAGDVSCRVGGSVYYN